jgi:hypothetical protein
MVLIFYYTTLLNLNLCMVLFKNNALKQKSSYSFVIYYVHLILDNSAKQPFTC